MKASSSITGGFRAVTDFVQPYPFPDPLPNNYEGDTFSFVIAGRREIPTGGDASLPLYAEDDLTVNYTVLPAGATLSGDACEISVLNGHDSDASPYEFSVGAGGSRAVDIRDLIRPTAGGGAIRCSHKARIRFRSSRRTPTIPKSGRSLSTMPRIPA